MKRLIFVPLAVMVALSAVCLSGASVQMARASHVVQQPAVSAVQLAETKLPPTLDIVFNPTGTHVDSSGQLKIRLDFYPRPGNKTYEQQHVNMPVIPKGGYPGKVDAEGAPADQKDYDAWLASLPHEWKVNPVVCHFVSVPSSITKITLDAWVRANFDATTTATIDDAMSQTDSAHLISPFMRSLTTLGTESIAKSNEEQVKAAVNQSLAGFSIGAARVSSAPKELIPESIDVGSSAIDRTTSLSLVYTRVSGNNPANDTGTIDTIEIWANSNLSGCEIGFFYVVSGNNLSTRSNTTIGSVTAGSKQTFTGLSMAVSAGDYSGIYATGGQLERDNGGSASWRYYGDAIPCTNTAFIAYDAYEFSLYATGGGGVATFIPKVYIW